MDIPTLHYRHQVASYPLDYSHLATANITSVMSTDTYNGLSVALQTLSLRKQHTLFSITAIYNSSVQSDFKEIWQNKRKKKKSLHQLTGAKHALTKSANYSMLN